MRGTSAIVAFLLASGAPAAALAETRSIDRAEAVRLGAERNPSSLEARVALGSTAAVVSSSRSALSYAPRVQLVGGARLGLGPELGASVMQDFSVRGLGSARRDTADAFERAARAEATRARVEGAQAAALAWVDLLENETVFVHRQQSLLEATELARIAKARVDRGVGTPLEAALATADAGAAEVALRDAEGRVFEARAHLRYALALPADVEPHAQGTLETTGPPPEAPIEDREVPALVAARARTQLSTAEARLATAQATSPFGVGVAYMREGTGEQTFTGVLSFPLPFFDPTRFEAARHESAIRISQAGEQRIRAEALRTGAMARHEREHTREVRDAVRERVVAPLAEAVRIGISGYRNGTQEPTTLFLLRQRLVAAEEQLDRAHGDVQRADTTWAAMTGTLLRPASTK